MNSYFDQQWDQQLAGRPQALAAFEDWLEQEYRKP